MSSRVIFNASNLEVFINIFKLLFIFSAYISIIIIISITIVHL